MPESQADINRTAPAEGVEKPSAASGVDRLAALDHAHVWHPFTPMKQWRESPPLVIERAEGSHLIDTQGRRYIDGVSSLWCNVHGHRVPAIDQAIREQLDKVAHSTLLGLASPPSIELAAKLVEVAPGGSASPLAWPVDGEWPASFNGLDSHILPSRGTGPLNKVFYSDAGATALEVAFKMAVGYWHHNGKPDKTRFIGMRGAYHGDTTGSMSVGYSDLFHRAFKSMVFETDWFDVPDACRPQPDANLRCDDFTCGACDAMPRERVWPSECGGMTMRLAGHCIAELKQLLKQQADRTAAIVIEPVMQGAAGMLCQPPGFVNEIARLAREHDVLLIADEVATGFGRTGAMFACENEGVIPDILCVAKGITGGYLPLAATICTDAIEQAFCGELEERKTLYHGHTYTGNPLACAAALASLELFNESPSGAPLLEHINTSAGIIRDMLDPLRDCPNVRDIRQRGLMVGIELCRDRENAEPFDFSKRTGYALCDAMRERGVIVRPLGDVLILMPIPAMPHDTLRELLSVVTETVLGWRFD